MSTATVKAIVEGIKRDLGDKAKERNILVSRDKGCTIIKLYTYSNEYMIRIRDNDGYVTCGASSRKAKPGETRSRSIQLFTGHLNDVADLWVVLMANMFRCEVVDLAESTRNPVAHSEIFNG